MISRDVSEVSQSWPESITFTIIHYRISISEKIASETAKEGFSFCSFLPLVFVLSTFLTVLIKKCSVQVLDFGNGQGLLSVVLCKSSLKSVPSLESLAGSHFSREPMDVFMLSHQIYLLIKSVLPNFHQAFI